MKKILCTLLSLIILLSVAGCSSGGGGSSTSAGGGGNVSSGGGGSSAAAPQQENYRIGIFFKDATTMFWRYVASGADEKAKELGVEVIEYSPTSYTDSAGQLSMLEDAIESGIDAICIAAIDSTAVVDVLLKAEERGIPVIVFNTLIPDFAASGKQRVFVGIDNYEASFEVTDKILKEYNYKCNLVILEGTPATQINFDRTDPIYAIQKENPGVNIVSVQPCNANREKALTVMENILQSEPNIDVVWALNDPTALGALQAIEAANRTGIEIVSIDGTPEAVAAIVKGRGIKYTADQAPFDMGAFTIQAAYDILTGKGTPERIYCGGTLIGPDNAEEHLKTFYPEYEY